MTKINDINKPMCEFCTFHTTPCGKHTCYKKSVGDDEESTSWSSKFGSYNVGNLEGETLYPEVCEDYSYNRSIGFNDKIFHNENEDDWKEIEVFQAVYYEKCPKGWMTNGYFLSKEKAEKKNEFYAKYSKTMIFKHNIKYPCICFIDHVYGSIHFDNTYDNIYVSFGTCKHCGRKWKRDNAVSRYAKLDTVMFQQK